MWRGRVSDNASCVLPWQFIDATSLSWMSSCFCLAKKKKGSRSLLQSWRHKKSLPSNVELPLFLALFLKGRRTYNYRPVMSVCRYAAQRRFWAREENNKLDIQDTQFKDVLVDPFSRPPIDGIPHRNAWQPELFPSKTVFQETTSHRSEM